MVSSSSFRNALSEFGQSLIRRKPISSDAMTETKLARVLDTIDLTALGVGATLGAGIYVVAGEVAKNTAGPSVICSFFIAAAASVLAGLCYAEFGARVPKTGSAYCYSYVSVGEFMAFIIGWNMILEYVIGTASVARAWSANLDKLIGNHISTFSIYYLSFDSMWFADYPDFLAFFIAILLALILAIGVKESSFFNKIFTFVNLCVVAFVIICGLFFVDFRNWKLSANHTVNEAVIFNRNVANGTSYKTGSGGFFPFGLSGVLSGAGTCFYAFVGFDSIAATGEEVKNPQKSIPISIVLCLLICFFAYFGISAVITLICPFYLIDSVAPLPSVFEYVDFSIAKYIISVGAVCALSTSLLGAMFPLPRVIYAMATDGLIFRQLGIVSERFKTPLIATALSGVLAGSMACFFNLKDLVDMMSIGTLLAYSLVAVSVMILRGSQTSFVDEISVNDDETSSTADSDAHLMQNKIKMDTALRNNNSYYFRYVFKRKSKYPDTVTEAISTANTYFFYIVSWFICGSLIAVEFLSIYYVALTVVLSFLAVLFLVSYSFQPENRSKISFKVPLVPWIPAISILVNTYLMMKLPVATWFRFSVWLTIGLIIYFSYGIWNSSERKNSSVEYPIAVKNIDMKAAVKEYHDKQEDYDNADDDVILPLQTKLKLAVESKNNSCPLYETIDDGDKLKVEVMLEKSLN